MELARIFGIIGLLFITWGIFAKTERQQDWIFIIGGVCLFVYSYWLDDLVFMTLQVVFTGASAYELFTLRKKKTFMSRLKKHFK